MMTHMQLFRSAIFAAALGVVGSAFGQTPTCAAPGCNSVTTDGFGNTASGSNALQVVDTENGAIGNTANGNYALYFNTTGKANTASGNSALLENTTGYYNTAFGYKALFSNSTGSHNTSSGDHALVFNTTGNRNNAFGEGALYSSTTADDNNAMGVSALNDNTTGALNNAVGNFAMEYNTTGSNNNAVGYGAMLRNTTGSDNSAQGYEALGGNRTGNLNIAIGYKAGYSQTSGSQNIYLGNSGVAAESNVIRIGSSSGVSIQNAAFIAGISGNVQTGGTVVVTASGQLGVASSSRRYKQDIEPLGDVSERLFNLRPVKFRYIKPDEQGQKPVQFGLIAEEVAEVLPEVVYRNAEGKVEGVRYDELTPMLLSEVQQLHKQVAAQAAQLAEMSELKGQVAELKSLVATLSNLPKDERVAMR
jgi:Chaperone of endosialidase